MCSLWPCAQLFSDIPLQQESQSREGHWEETVHPCGEPESYVPWLQPVSVKGFTGDGPLKVARCSRFLFQLLGSTPEIWTTEGGWTQNCGSKSMFMQCCWTSLIRDCFLFPLMFEVLGHSTAERSTVSTIGARNASLQFPCQLARSPETGAGCASGIPGRDAWRWIDKGIQHSKGPDVNGFAHLSSFDHGVVPPSHHDMSWHKQAQTSSAFHQALIRFPGVHFPFPIQISNNKWAFYGLYSHPVPSHFLSSHIFPSKMRLCAWRIYGTRPIHLWTSQLATFASGLAKSMLRPRAWSWGFHPTAVRWSRWIFAGGKTRMNQKAMLSLSRFKIWNWLMLIVGFLHSWSLINIDFAM